MNDTMEVGQKLNNLKKLLAKFSILKNKICEPFQYSKLKHIVYSLYRVEGFLNLASAHISLY